MRPDERTLVVAADGAHARCFEERRQGGRLIEHPEWTADLAPGHGSRPSSGSVHDRMGHGMHGTAPRSSADHALEEYCARLAERIGGVFHDERFEALVLFAPPRALGRLREHLPPPVHARLVLDAPHEVLTETDEELRHRLRELRFHAPHKPSAET